MATATAERSKLREGVWPLMADIITDGVHGDVRTELFTVDKEQAKWAAVMSQGRECVLPGRYARLNVGRGIFNDVMMSDTDMERRTNLAAVLAARGDVLIGGLGIGMVPCALQLRNGIRSVTVVEKNADVIALVEPMLRRWQALMREQAALRCDRFSVVHADVHAYAAQARYDYVWLDIWPHVCVDDYAEHKALRARYRRMVVKGGKVDSWQFAHLQELVRSGRWR